VNLDILIVSLYSYIFGSIPFGLLITKIFIKKDVRKIGSGNIGATNVLRTGKKSLAILTLLLDIFKGYISVFIAILFFKDLVYLAALICFIGHIYPIWLKFKGGKGVATFLGIILGFSFNLAFIFGIIWLIILYIFKYSSLSSIISTFSLLLYSVYLNNFDLSTYLFIVFVIILHTHRQNIIRLKNKTENKIKF
tara:strand:+ start:1695 stop:2276 length:582 start_codon:yes stop_codon:yes gene_type:complete